MTFLELQNQVLRHLRDASGHMRTAVKEWIRFTMYELADRGDFDWWKSEGTFATDSFFATGRASVKVDKMQVSGSATGWKKYFADMKMVFSASSPGSTRDWYRVANRPSSTKINLAAHYRGAAKTRKRYVLFRDEVRLRYDVDRILQVRSLSEPDKLVNIWRRELFDWDANPSRVGDPLYYRIPAGGVAERPLYNKGSASWVANSYSVGGKNGASWDTYMVGNYIRNTSDGRVYEIASVTGATALKLKSAYTGSNTGSKKYEIGPVGTPVIQLYPIPLTKQHYVYEYQRLPRLPYADADVPDLPIKHHEILVWGALVRGHLQGAAVKPEILETAKQIYYQFTPEKMRAKASLPNDRIQRMGSFDNVPRWASGRLDPARWRYPG